jgi:hypothetical protein
MVNAGDSRVSELEEAIGFMTPTLLRVLLEILPQDAKIDLESTRAVLDRINKAMAKAAPPASVGEAAPDPNWVHTTPHPVRVIGPDGKHGTIEERGDAQSYVRLDNGHGVYLWHRDLKPENVPRPSEVLVCPDCKGTKVVESDDHRGGAGYETCYRCDGTGQRIGARTNEARIEHSHECMTKYLLSGDPNCPACGDGPRPDEACSPDEKDPAFCTKHAGHFPLTTCNAAQRAETALPEVPICEVCGEEHNPKRVYGEVEICRSCYVAAEHALEMAKAHADKASYAKGWADAVEQARKACHDVASDQDQEDLAEVADACAGRIVRTLATPTGSTSNG